MILLSEVFNTNCRLEMPDEVSIQLPTIDPPGIILYELLNVDTYCSQRLIIFIFELQMKHFGDQSGRAEFAERGLDTS